MKKDFELHLVLAADGPKSVQIVGPPDTHIEGHRLYFQIADLIEKFNAQVMRRLRAQRQCEVA